MNQTLDLTAFLTLVVTLFLMLIVGYVAGKTKIVSETASKNLSKLIIAIGQPALIIFSLVRMEYSTENLLLGLQTLGFGFALHGILAVFSFLAFLRFRTLDERKITEFAAIFGNVGFIGIPLLESLFGPKGAFMGAFFVVSFNVFLWTWGIMILARQRPDIKLTPKKLLNYGTVPSMIGLALFLLKGLLPRVLPEAFVQGVSYVAPPVLSCLSYMASLCTPVSMLIIGALLATRSLRQIFLSGKIYYLSFIKLLVFPLLVALAMRLMGFDTGWILFGVTVTAMPCATTVTMLAELHDIAPGYSAQAVGTTSLLSIATMPCVLWITQRILEW